MASTDPISDMITQIRNAIMVGKTDVEVPYSAIKDEIAQLLQQNNFVYSVRTRGTGINKLLQITINQQSTNPSISAIERISSPGRRQYVNVRNIPIVKRGRGIVIMSTSKGLMTGTQAKRKRLGGELICKVY